MKISILKQIIMDELHDPWIKIMIMCILIAFISGILFSSIECIKAGVVFTVCLIIVTIINYMVCNKTKHK